jgi:peptidyl-prolyl cis-trans isomerase B (cyclophilin B)
MIHRCSIFVLFFLLVLACACTSQSPEKDTENKLTASDSASDQEIHVDDLATKPPKYPILGNDNAEAFLRTYFENNTARKIKLTTRYGALKIELFEDTPLHTANFLMMVERDYFSGTEFTRVVKDFVVQGGNSEKETDEIKRLIIGNYLIGSEILDKHIHRQGALAMARSYDDNPEKRSSAYDFYIVVGRTFNEPQLMALAREHEMEIPEWKRKIYRKTGGAPHLDGQHTVFGQVYEGIDVLEKMSNTPIDESNWPLESLIMKMEVINE